MKRLFCTLAVSALLVTGSSSAQGGADLATQLQRLSEGMASGDPTARMVALDEGTNSQLPPVRRKAVELGLTSSDADLRAMALAASFRTKASYNIVVHPAPDGESDRINNTLSGNLDVQIADFDETTGNFFAYSSMSKETNRGRAAGEQPTYEVRPGNVSGIRVQFGLSLSYSLIPQCEFVAELVDGAPNLAGTLRCGRHSTPITIALLE